MPELRERNGSRLLTSSEYDSLGYDPSRWDCFFSEHGFYLARSWIKPSSVKSYHCDNCELLITDLKDVNPKLRK